VPVLISFEVRQFKVGEDLPLEIAPPIYETREGVLHVTWHHLAHI
jgi:hypothetical protein